MDVFTASNGNGICREFSNHLTCMQVPGMACQFDVFCAVQEHDRWVEPETEESEQEQRQPVAA